MDDLLTARLPLVCNLCGRSSCGVSAIITRSIPERGIWMGDTYHFGCLPSDVEFLHCPVPETEKE